MQYPKAISELLRLRHKRLDDLAACLTQRATILAGVKAALPAALAEHVATAGLEGGRLSLGVTSAAWASRLRYAIGEARERIAASCGVAIDEVRIRVVRSRPPPQV
ncbi:MAG TPA: DciA family protein [Steroidobacteraceae bacterium]|nr:DciA family protein [Steroidobacteraceae bacterium]